MLYLMIKKIIPGLRENIVPAVFLQIFAASLGFCYYYWPASHIVFDFVAGLKLQYGIWYALWATAIFGGLIPYSYLYFTNRIDKKSIGLFSFYLLFWAAKGAEADLFYRLQSFIFGDGHDVLTVMKKVAVDQFIFAVFWIAPTITIVYTWMENGFCFHRLSERLTREFLFEKIPLNAITNWLVWMPAVFVIYMMPSALQVPMFNLVVCFFALLVAVVNRDVAYE